MADLTFVTDPAAALRRAEHAVLVAPRERLAAGGLLRAVFPGAWAKGLSALVEDTKPGPLGKAVTTWPGQAGAPRRVTLGVLPDRVSRWLSASRAHAIAEVLGKAEAKGRVGVVVALDDPAHARAAAAAVARTLPRERRKRDAKAPEVTVAFVDARGRPFSGKAAPDPGALGDLAHAVRWAAALVDRPAAEKSPAQVVDDARRLVGKLGRAKVLVGPALRKAGLGGVHAVGRAAAVAPRLLVLEAGPARAARTVALVGKGVVFDTGGLHLKPRGGMEGMKSDLGGAAAVAAAFWVLARGGLPRGTRLVALLPLVENAIGPDSYRPDDVLTLHSGKTVEINNTDAEGRLLLADCVSYAARALGADVVIDAATLTGAQGIATGKRHAAVVSNRAGLEALALEAGHASGDLVCALPFAPELYQAEFKSELADMTNSVADRSNAQVSCAAQFVYGHVEDLDRPWLHVDLASPAFVGRRGTGFGVGLLVEVVRRLGPAHLEA